jgi:hypothetical protein
MLRRAHRDQRGITSSDYAGILVVVSLVFLALFLLSSQISELAFPDEAKARTIGGVTQAPIVMVLLDELPNADVEAATLLRCLEIPGAQVEP